MTSREGLQRAAGRTVCPRALWGTLGEEGPSQLRLMGENERRDHSTTRVAQLELMKFNRKTSRTPAHHLEGRATVGGGGEATTSLGFRGRMGARSHCGDSILKTLSRISSERLPGLRGGNQRTCCSTGKPEKRMPLGDNDTHIRGASCRLQSTLSILQLPAEMIIPVSHTRK